MHIVDVNTLYSLKISMKKLRCAKSDNCGDQNIMIQLFRCFLFKYFVIISKLHIKCIIKD